MRRVFKSRFFLVFTSLALLLAAAALFSSFTKSINPIRAAAMDAARPGQLFFLRVFDRIDEFFHAFTGYEELMAENDVLRLRVAELEYEIKQNSALEEENEALRTQLSLPGRDAGISYLRAEIIASGGDGYQALYTLDRGSEDGLKPGMAVVTPEGLAGFIKQCAAKSSTVCALYSPESVCAVRTVRSGCSAIASGSYFLRESGLVRMSYIEKDADISPTDIVETAGGGLYPAGIAVGMVSSVSLEEHALSAYALVKPFAKLEGQRPVFVITGFTEER